MIWDGIEWDGTRVKWQDRVEEDNVGGERHTWINLQFLQNSAN